MLSVVKMLLKGGGVGGRALNIHGNHIVDHGIVFLNFCGNPVHTSWSADVSYWQKNG